MGIINRDLGASEQRYQVLNNFTPMNTGSTAIIFVAPEPTAIDLAQAAAVGLSGVPVYTLFIDRFIVGSGFTTFILGASFSAVAYGTSGVFGYSAGVSLPQIGSTLTQLQTNDVVLLVSGGANTAAASLSLSLVVRPLLDINKFFGIL